MAIGGNMICEHICLRCGEMKTFGNTADNICWECRRNVKVSPPKPVEAPQEIDKERCQCKDCQDLRSVFCKPTPAPQAEMSFDDRMMEGQYKMVEYHTAWQAALELDDDDEAAFKRGFDAGYDAAKGSR